MDVGTVVDVSTIVEVDAVANVGCVCVNRVESIVIIYDILILPRIRSSEITKLLTT